MDALTILGLFGVALVFIGTPAFDMFIDWEDRRSRRPRDRKKLE